MSTIENNRDKMPDTFNMSFEIPDDLKDIIKECILNNTDVRIECNDKECTYQPKGQPLEVGLIHFLIDNGEDINSSFIERNRYSPKLT
jgi:hypothetical protein